MKAESIGQILQEQTSLTEHQLSEALSLQARETEHRRIGQILAREGHVTDSEVLKALSRQWDLSYLDKIPQGKLDRDLVTSLPIEFLKRHKILPFGEGNGTVTVAVADPLDVMAFDAVANILGRPCERAVCASSAIEDGLSRYYYEDDGSTSKTLTGLDSDEELASLTLGSGTEDLLDLANRAPVVKLVNTFFFQAVQTRASDIHVEPYEGEV